MIIYKTEGCAELPNIGDPKTDKIVLKWIKADSVIKMMSGTSTITLCKEQLKLLADMAPEICSDLVSHSGLKIR